MMRSAAMMKATAACLEILGPFDKEERMHVIIGVIMACEAGSGSAIDKTITELMRRTVPKAAL